MLPPRIKQEPYCHKSNMKVLVVLAFCVALSLYVTLGHSYIQDNQQQNKGTICQAKVKVHHENFKRKLTQQPAFQYLDHQCNKPANN